MTPEPPPKPSDRSRIFDNEGFFAALDVERSARSMHWKAVADEAGVSASTLTRIGQGRRPDVDSFAALTRWAGLDADSFFLDSEPTRRNAASPLTNISMLLRHDPKLSKDSAAAIEEILRATYNRLREPE
jgi:transcriptional regulator with XRE-family HTH domain